MTTSKLFLIGSLALIGALFAPSAQADDHRHHRGDRHEYRNHHHGRYYGGGSDYYYNDRPGIVYDQPYYGNTVTFAFGGHRHHRHHHHD